VSRIITGREVLPYTIRFENETNATAPAQQVVISDQLNANLDWTTLQWTEIGWGDQLIVVPPNRQHFETTVPMSMNGTDFDVQVVAAINASSGLAQVTFRSINPATGLPPSVDIGFLPPEDGTGRGQGHFSYTIRPKADLPTGTQIRNVALISFDNQPVIGTDQVDPHNPGAGIDPAKQCLNTIDSGIPSSSVAALPPESGRAFWVNWSGQDDTGGSGLANYDVYASTNGVDFDPWLLRTTSTTASFIGELGQTYYFACSARDNVGNEAPAPTAPQAFTTVSTNSPVLDVVSDQTLRVGAPFSITNLVSQVFPSGAYEFYLLQGPQGLHINPTNGTVDWVPPCNYGSTTNPVTVWVTDATQTNLSDSLTFNLVVTECIEPQLGTLILPVGQRGRLPVHLISSELLTNLSMTLHLPVGHLEDPSVEVHETATNFVESATVEQMTNLLHLINLAAYTNTWMHGTQEVAWLYITAATNQPSGFHTVLISDFIGTQPDGTRLTNLNSQVGRVVVVGDEPLLEAVMSTNREPLLIVYGYYGTTNTLEAKTALQGVEPWRPVGQAVIPTTNLLEVLDNVVGTNRTIYYRALRE
jgi:hypothetical protein